MITVYKLTRADRTTRDGFTYPIGEPVTLDTPRGTGLCNPEYLHAYRTPLLAAFFAPIHVDDTYSVLWRAETPEIHEDDGTKLGLRSLTLIEPVEMPVMSTAARVRAAIEASLLVPQSDAYRAWAVAWLSGEDRSRETAWAAATAAAWAAATAADAAWAAARAAAHIDIDALIHAAIAEEEQP